MRILCSIVFVFLSVVTATSQNYPAYTELYVNDFAAVLDDGQTTRLRGTLTELKEKRGIEFTVVTLNSLDEHGHSGPIEPFATGLFNAWGVGDASRNDGVMMLVALGDRAMCIEVGSGYGASLDGAMRRVIDGTILPEFRDNNYPEGILAGVDEAIYQITGTYPGDYDAPQYEVIAKRGWQWVKGLGGFAWVLLAPVAFGVWRLGQFVLRRRPRRCPNDGTWMIWLSEKDDDHHLLAGQLKEENLKSVDYDVWLCPACDNAHVIRRGAWFASYKKCRNCAYHTVSKTSVVRVEPTENTGGTTDDDYSCLHCNEAWTVSRSTPSLAESRRSSSSSSGGFGGGRSSGGGASGRW